MAIKTRKISIAVGERKAVATMAGHSRVLIKNVSALANDAYVGGSDVDDTNGYKIAQTEEVEMDVSGPVFVYGAAAVDVVAIWND